MSGGQKESEGTKVKKSGSTKIKVVKKKSGARSSRRGLQEKVGMPKSWSSTNGLQKVGTTKVITVKWAWP